jgi:hypothetical protein
VHILFLIMHFILIMVYFIFFLAQFNEHMITLLKEFKLCYFLWQHEILQFNLIFTSTFGK